jgi:hypothetical protein
MSTTVYLPATELHPDKRQWELSDLWRISSKLEVSYIKVSDLWEQRYSKAWCWQHESEELNNEFFLHHMQRVLNADLSYAIILSEENYIFDGVHRLMKAKYLNQEYIKCVKFKKDPIPNNV